MWQKQYTNVLSYSAGCDVYFKNYCNMVGYKSFTTFFADLGTAEWFGEKSVKETFDNVTRNWLDDYKWYTEFVFALNLKSWYWYENGEQELSKLYCDLFYKAKDKFYKKYSGNVEACDYFFDVTD